MWCMRVTFTKLIVQAALNICAVSRNIPDIFDCYLKKNGPILIFFDTNIPDRTGQQMTV